MLGDAPQRYRVFIASPGDVDNERGRALQVIARINGEFKDEFQLFPVDWRKVDYALGDPFQTQIESPTKSDLVVGIVWARAGHPLDPERFRRPDGSAYESGTVYEIETALDHRRKHGRPEVVLYCRETDPPAGRGEPGHEVVRQRDVLAEVIDRWTLTAGGEFKGGYNGFSALPEFEEKFQRCLRSWLGTFGFDTDAPTWRIDQHGSPFPGLTPYDEQYQRVFFGRENAVRLCDEQLREAALRDCAFLLIVGASGSGKSSLARAGLMPRIAIPSQAPRVNKWRSARMLPGTAPLQGLASTLFAAVPSLAACTPDPVAWSRRVASHPPFAAISLAQAVAEDERLLLLVDQLEEVFVQAPDGFASALDALARGGKASVIATLRADRYGGLDPTLLALKRDGALYDLLIPGPDEIETIIRKPARAAGLTFEPGREHDLGKVLREAVAGADALPLLQMTLAQLFKERDPDTGKLTFAAYQAIGGIEGAIGRHADDVILHLGRAEQLELRPLLLELATTGQDGEYLARPVSRSAFEASPARQTLVTTLLQARLLVVDRQSVLRVAHEALLRNWRAARDILDKHDLLLRVRDQLEPLARLWRAEGQPATQVLRAGRLLSDAATVLMQLRETSDSELLVAFVEASLQEQERGRKLLGERLAGDEQKILGHLTARDYRAAATQIAEVVGYLTQQTDDDLAAFREVQQARQRRVGNLADFYEAAKAAWSLAGEEDFVRALAACERALTALGWICKDSRWWHHLPIDDIEPENIEHLKQEAYRTLLLFSGLQLVPGLIGMFPRRQASAPKPKPIVDVGRLAAHVPRFILSAVIGAGGIGPFKLPARQGNSQALEAFRKSIAVLSQVRDVEQARAAEKGESSRPSRTSYLVRQIVEVLEEFAAGPKGAAIDYRRWLGVPTSTSRPEPVDAADYFFIGLFNFFVAKRPEGIMPKIISLLQGSFPDLDGDAPLRTAERLLRIAVALEPRNYWPHWALGRTLQTSGDHGGAELAFNAAIALNPDYARGYEQRALTLGHQWSARKEDMLRERALRDSGQATSVADGDPSIFWPRGELLQLLGRTRDAVEAYSQWLELEQDILGLIARATGVARLYVLANDLIGRTPPRDAESRALSADTRALLALVHLTWADADGALAAAGAALEIDPRHAHALTVRGGVLYQNGEFHEAISAFELALDRDPANYRAALNRAMAYERIGTAEVALAAWRELAAMSARATCHRCPQWMLESAEAAQSRILPRLQPPRLVAAAR
jgi:tetratricopeptide (TPR) repeat protein